LASHEPRKFAAWMRRTSLPAGLSRRKYFLEQESPLVSWCHSLRDYRCQFPARRNYTPSAFKMPHAIVVEKSRSRSEAKGRNKKPTVGEAQPFVADEGWRGPLTAVEPCRGWFHETSFFAENQAISSAPPSPHKQSGR